MVELPEQDSTSQTWEVMGGEGTNIYASEREQIEHTPLLVMPSQSGLHKDSIDCLIVSDYDVINK